MSDRDDPSPSEAQRTRLGRLGGAVSPGVIACIAAGYAGPHRFFPALLAAVVFATAVGCGALAFVVGQQGTGARHAARARRPMEWLAVLFGYLFVPCFALVQAGHLLWGWWPAASTGGWTARWFHSWPFGARMFLYLFGWTIVGAGYARGSRKLDDSARPHTIRKLHRVAWPMAAFAFAVTCAAAGDWVLGLDVGSLRPAAIPLAGLYLVADGGVSAIAILAIVTVVAQRAGFLRRLWSDAHRRRVAGWLAIAVVVWAAAAATAAVVAVAAAPATYAAWRGHWLAGSWETVTFVAIGAHAIGLAILIAARGSARALVVAAGVLVFGGIVDAYQLVMPAFSASGVPSWIDVGAFAGLLGVVWLAVVMKAAKEPFYPVHDPALEDAA